MTLTRKLRRAAIIREDYPHHTSLRGQVGFVTRDYEDGTVLMKFEDGEHAGDSVCLLKQYVELLS